MKKQLPNESMPEAALGSYKTYITGFLLSIILTMDAYLVVAHHVDSHHKAFSHSFLMVWLVGLAIVQLFVQLIYFLHLAKESKPRWNLTIAVFAVIVVGILVFGTLWIMGNLNYHAVSPHQTDTYIIHDEGISE
jgi:cytochrome o ubiquinol oxidase operon protein cyoD